MKGLGAGAVCFSEGYKLTRCALSRCAMPFIFFFTLFFILALAVFSAAAQTPGVTDDHILIGSCSPLDGPVRVLGNDTVMGATTYLHSINDEGGI